MIDADEKIRGNDLLIDGKTLVRDWPDCPTPYCERKVCMWAGTGLCHPCSVIKIGREVMDRKYKETHAG